jgi:hypothetical protein
MFTPSQIHRVEKCPVSEALPHIQRETQYSAAGTAAHKLMARIRELRGAAASAGQAREIALREVEDPEHLAVLEALPLDDPRMPSLDPSAYTAELAMALNLTTGTARILGKGLTREQAAARAHPMEMVGIADLAAQAGDEAVVLDLKFGHGRVPRAAVNLQTDTYLLMLSLALQLDGGGTQGIVRVFGEDDVWTDVVQRDSLELDDHFERLRRLARQVEELRARPPAERPAPVEGAWCTYCPAFLSCPAKRALLYALVHDPVRAGRSSGAPSRSSSAWSTSTRNSPASSPSSWATARSSPSASRMASGSSAISRRASSRSACPSSGRPWRIRPARR